MPCGGCRKVRDQLAELDRLYAKKTPDYRDDSGRRLVRVRVLKGHVWHWVEVPADGGASDAH